MQALDLRNKILLVGKCERHSLPYRVRRKKQTSHTVRHCNRQHPLPHLLGLVGRVRLSVEVVVPGLLILHLLAMMLLCHCMQHLLCTKQCLRGYRLVLMLRAGQLLHLHCLLGLPTGLQGRVGGGKARLMQMLETGHCLPSLLGLPTTLGGEVGLKGRLPTKLRSRAGGKGG